jgi:hypothetical protein
MGKLSSAKPGYVRSKGSHHASTRRRGSGTRDVEDGFLPDSKYGLRGNAPKLRGQKKK